jgi:hypothetical protein
MRHPILRLDPIDRSKANGWRIDTLRFVTLFSRIELLQSIQMAPKEFLLTEAISTAIQKWLSLISSADVRHIHPNAVYGFLPQEGVFDRAFHLHQYALLRCDPCVLPTLINSARFVSFKKCFFEEAKNSLPSSSLQPFPIPGYPRMFSQATHLILEPECPPALNASLKLLRVQEKNAHPS